MAGPENFETNPSVPDSSKRTVSNKLGEDGERGVKKSASELVDKADVYLGIGDMKSDYWEKQKQIAKREATSRKREKALGKRERLRNRLAEQGATEEALLAFESAYDPKIAPKIKQILTDQKLDIQQPDTWVAVHKLLTTPSEDKPYFCEAYVDAYQEYIPIVPLVSPEEKPQEGEAVVEAPKPKKSKKVEG